MSGLAVARPDEESGPREREVIAAFADITTEAITATRLEDLLALVGQKLCLLLGVRRCSVYLRQADGRFRGAAGWCGDDGNISAAVQAQEAGIPGDAFSREVIRSAAPVLITDVANDPRPHRRTMEHWGVRAMLGVPLVFDGDVIGLIFVDNVARDHTYTDDEISLGELFGGLAALVIRQALQASRLAAQAEELDRQKRMLEFLADVHAKLTGAVLEGADIRAVVELLSDLARAPVALLDEGFAVLTWTAPSALRAGPPVVGGAGPRPPRPAHGARRALRGAAQHGARALVADRAGPPPRHLPADRGGPPQRLPRRGRGRARAR
jgi:GAF domain-containing protein